MVNKELSISIIIPTHNRCDSLKRLLNCLASQTYPVHLMEVIVVADGCKDTTIEILKTYPSLYKLVYIEQTAQGAAAARNKGASLATSDVLLFLDDDIEPSPGLVKAHAQLHYKPNRVVIGYLPLPLTKKAGFFHISLCSWWEATYQNMRNPGYRYSYEDLLSGNFSISSELFRSLNGFNSAFRCREDYELGVRLIKSGARFIFSKEAWGYHRDQITNLDRSLKRKRLEGKADVEFGSLHPELIVKLRLARLKPYRSVLQSVLFILTFRMPKVSDSIAVVLRYLLNVREWLRMRQSWKEGNDTLHWYWYLRGVADKLGSKKNLFRYLQQNATATTQNEEIELDLKDGISAVEKQLDQKRPSSVRLKYGNHLIGNIPDSAGAEHLRGQHLRFLLATNLSWSLMEVMTQESLGETIGTSVEAT